MSWTYNAAGLANDVYKVRLSIGDTVETLTTTLQDEEIQFRLDSSGSVSSASIDCARDRIAKVATLTDRQVSSVSASRSQLVANLESIVSMLKERASDSSTMTAYPVGTSKAHRETLRADTDYIQPPTRVGMSAVGGYTGSPELDDD